MPKAGTPAPAVLKRSASCFSARTGALRLSGERRPGSRTLAGARKTGAVLPLAHVSPFLENFLIDAEECWRAGGDRRASGPWVETGTARGAVGSNRADRRGPSLLLLQRLGDAFEAKKSMLQKARETVIAYQRLNSEIQKKEILFHCVSDEMSAALANIVTSFRLLEQENHSPQPATARPGRARDRRTAGAHPQGAVRLCGRGERALRTRSRGNMRRTGRRPERAWQRHSLRKSKKKGSSPHSRQLARRPSAAAFAQLERVVANLIENALEHPHRRRVAILVDDEGDCILSVEDNGAAVSPDACDNLFSKSADTGARAHAAIAFLPDDDRSCGGEIGGGPRGGGGNRFWIRIPKAIVK